MVLFGATRYLLSTPSQGSITFSYFVKVFWHTKLYSKPSIYQTDVIGWVSHGGMEVAVRLSGLNLITISVERFLASA